MTGGRNGRDCNVEFIVRQRLTRTKRNQHKYRLNSALIPTFAALRFAAGVAAWAAPIKARDRGRHSGVPSAGGNALAQQNAALASTA
ncbi:hypothetical protein BST14_08860 [Mycobacterium arosiense ATCC BAA-1401 = DSM 45069]|uniref:Uncharacterized protein n=1 Tax=Mycobacterium arosiense ATCC BAA-1401 = DSM 45069 TaxID=1265311 RepID=A0A1W9ZKD9_MYCAI|nr:hypothetical protein BST14_08860 [Mycobacterium arosiense ATCC BAA-1401 = DSM 45069]